MADASERIGVGKVVSGLDQQLDRKVKVAEVLIKVGDNWSAGLRRGGCGETRLHRPHAKRSLCVG